MWRCLLLLKKLSNILSVTFVAETNENQTIYIIMIIFRHLLHFKKISLETELPQNIQIYARVKILKNLNFFLQNKIFICLVSLAIVCPFVYPNNVKIDESLKYFVSHLTSSEPQGRFISALII